MLGDGAARSSQPFLYPRNSRRGVGTDARRNDPRLAFQVIPGDDPVVETKDHVRDCARDDIRRRPPDALELCSPVIADVAGDPSLEGRETGERLALMRRQYRPRLV